MLFLTVLTFSSVYGYYHFETTTSQYQRVSSSEQEELEVKWNYYGKIRRFTVRSDKISIYEELGKTLRLYEPAFQGILTWKDSENDSVLLNSSNELSVALKYKADKFLRLNTIDDRFDDFQVTKEPMILHELSKQLAKTEGICPIVIIRNYKHEDEKIQADENQADKKKMVETARKIMEGEISLTTAITSTNTG